MSDRIEDGVGKKIVEALRMSDNEFDEPHEESKINLGFEKFVEPEVSVSQESSVASRLSPTFIETAFKQSIDNNLNRAQTEVEADNFDYPANVKVIKQLISKLPAGVSKQTGALIIRQTMEALGISMKTVIEEARQVQADLNGNAQECQNSISDFKRQISMLELKSQQCQRQAAAMNDIIGLFVNTGL